MRECEVGGVRTPGSRAYTLASAGWPAPGVRRQLTELLKEVRFLGGVDIRLAMVNGKSREETLFIRG